MSNHIIILSYILKVSIVFVILQVTCPSSYSSSSVAPLLLHLNTSLNFLSYLSTSKRPWRLLQLYVQMIALSQLSLFSSKRTRLLKPWLWLFQRAKPTIKETKETSDKWPKSTKDGRRKWWEWSRGTCWLSLRYRQDHTSLKGCSKNGLKGWVELRMRSGRRGGQDELVKKKVRRIRAGRRIM